VAVPFWGGHFCLYPGAPIGLFGPSQKETHFFQAYAGSVRTGLYTNHTDVGNPYIDIIHVIISVARDDYALFFWIPSDSSEYFTIAVKYNLQSIELVIRTNA
jgi:hypothetical protein